MIKGQLEGNGQPNYVEHCLVLKGIVSFAFLSFGDFLVMLT